MNRRQFLTTLAAGSLLVPTCRYANADNNKHAHYFSAHASNDGRHYVRGFDDQGKPKFSCELPSRGHALAVHPELNHVTAVARRPGTYLKVMDGETGETLHQQESRENRHFYGHSLYSADGRWFYTPENDIENRRGVIGVRDVHNGYKQVAEFSAHGVGPHEMAMLSDGKTLVVANGGILTLPETGRKKLNVETMSPSLTYIDAESGKLLEQRTLPQSLNKNSIRHLDVNANDQVCFAMQYQGKDASMPQLVGLHSRGGELTLMNAPGSVLKEMRNYCGSVCSDISGHWFAVSSPKGGLITFWSAKERGYVSNVKIADGCGIAAGVENGEFLLSSGKGGVYRYRIGSGQLQTLERVSNVGARWDNHIARRNS